MSATVIAEHSPSTPAHMLESPYPAAWPKLTIVIPALNEQDSIASTIQRCLDARKHIQSVGKVREVEIIVVSDGSTDRTATIAQGYAAREPAVSVVVFETNRGYGAALKEGFRRATGELVSFLDADGTCDPRYFADMCQALQQENAAIVLGSRMSPGNQMPWVRRMGNHLYACLLGFLSGRAVSDTASGMRVLHRDSLAKLYPLPDGLHFTPSMSARALLSDLRVVEVPMAYFERVGESKLRVLRDGVRFLVAIVYALLLYRPSRLFGLAAVVCAIMATAWGLYPLEHYWRHAALEEWMIYRVLLCAFLITCFFGLAAAAVFSDRLLDLVYKSRAGSFLGQITSRLFAPSCLMIFATCAFATALFLVWPGLMEYLQTGHTGLHWSRAIVAVFLAQMALMAGVMAVLQKIVSLWRQQLDYHARNHDASRPV